MRRLRSIEGGGDRYTPTRYSKGVGVVVAGVILTTAAAVLVIGCAAVIVWAWRAAF